jgi:four helix bundle protein
MERKDSLETKYWVDLLRDTNYIEKQDYDLIHSRADELSRILFSIPKTTRLTRQDLQRSYPRLLITDY